jgi:hypothetical protein
VPDLIASARATLAMVRSKARVSKDESGAGGTCKRCGKPKHVWQIYCGAACTAKAEAGE